MRMELLFSVNGRPVGQPRQRFTTSKKTGRPRAYKDESHPVEGWKNDIRKAAMRVMGGCQPVKGPIALALYFRFPTSDKRQRGKPKDTKPDLDNLEKAFMDAASGILWEDDAQVVYLNSSKKYAVAPDMEGVYVEMRFEESDNKDFSERNEPEDDFCIGHGHGGSAKCCDRAGDYNGYGGDGPTIFKCPVSCTCHD